MATLAETFDALKQEEFQVKLAALQTAWEDDDDGKIDLLIEAIDIVKEAQTKGDLPTGLDEAQVLTLGAQMVEDYLSDSEEGGEENPAYETAEGAEEVTFDKVAELHGLGVLAGQILREQGITVEDLEKIASEEEAEDLGRYCAHVVVESLAASEDNE